jgi:hypothetical protein
LIILEERLENVFSAPDLPLGNFFDNADRIVLGKFSDLLENVLKGIDFEPISLTFLLLAGI